MPANQGFRFLDVNVDVLRTLGIILQYRITPRPVHINVGTAPPVQLGDDTMVRSITRYRPPQPYGARPLVYLNLATV